MIESLIDEVQRVVLAKRESLKYKKIHGLIENELRFFIQNNIDISKTYLPQATGHFKAHLEKVIRDSEKLLQNLTLKAHLQYLYENGN